MRTPRPRAVLALGIVSAAAYAKPEAAEITPALGADLVVPDDSNAVALVLTNAESGALLPVRRTVGRCRKEGGVCV